MCCIVKVYIEVVLIKIMENVIFDIIKKGVRNVR